MPGKFVQFWVDVLMLSLSAFLCCCYSPEVANLFHAWVCDIFGMISKHQFCPLETMFVLEDGLYTT